MQQGGRICGYRRQSENCGYADVRTNTRAQRCRERPYESPCASHRRAEPLIRKEIRPQSRRSSWKPSGRQRSTCAAHYANAVLRESRVHASIGQESENACFVISLQFSLPEAYGFVPIILSV